MKNKLIRLVKKAYDEKTYIKSQLTLGVPETLVIKNLTPIKEGNIGKKKKKDWYIIKSKKSFPTRTPNISYLGMS